jgi:hypothetical protein
MKMLKKKLKRKIHTMGISEGYIYTYIRVKREAGGG